MSGVADGDYEMAPGMTRDQFIERSYAVYTHGLYTHVCLWCGGGVDANGVGEHRPECAKVNEDGGLRTLGDYELDRWRAFEKAGIPASGTVTDLVAGLVADRDRLERERDARTQELERILDFHAGVLAARQTPSEQTRDLIADLRAALAVGVGDGQPGPERTMPCPACRGMGDTHGQTCPRCGGSGERPATAEYLAYIAGPEGTTQ